MPLNIDLLDSPDLLETTIDGVIGAPDTVETSQALDEINIATRQNGLEEPEVEGGSKQMFCIISVIIFYFTFLSNELFKSIPSRILMLWLNFKNLMGYAFLLFWLQGSLKYLRLHNWDH